MLLLVSTIYTTPLALGFEPFEVCACACVCASQHRCRAMPPPPAAASNLSWRRADGEPPSFTLDTPTRRSTATIIVRERAAGAKRWARRVPGLSSATSGRSTCVRAPPLVTFRSSRFARPLARERRRDGYIRAVGGRRRRFLPSSFRVTRHLLLPLSPSSLPFSPSCSWTSSFWATSRATSIRRRCSKTAAALSSSTTAPASRRCNAHVMSCRVVRRHVVPHPSRKIDVCGANVGVP